MDETKHSKSCVEHTGGYVRDLTPAGLHRVSLVPREWVERYFPPGNMGKATVNINIVGSLGKMDKS